MMQVTCLATGSSGNCYLVQCGNDYVILDAGIKIEKITSSVNLNNVLFCFISHEHKDHSKSIDKLKARGIKVLYGKYLTEPLGPKQIGPIKIWTLPIEHGDCHNCALIIQYCQEFLLYATDFSICRWSLKKFKFTQILVECNYLEESIKDTLDDKSNPNYSRAVRQINTHMGLNGTINFLKKQDLSKCKEIYLIHMSDTFGNGAVMGGLVYGTFKIPTFVCKKNGGVWSYGGE